MQKVLVTGVNGFVGKHLVRELVAQSCAIIGVGTEATAHPEIEDLITYAACDLTDSDQVAELSLDDVCAVINLAGLANVGQSFEEPEKYLSVNVAVLTVLARQLLAAGSGARMIAVSSGALYDPAQPMPLTEESRLAESSPYAKSKLLMEQAADELRREGLDCIVVRPFNHFGPGQNGGFLVPDLYTKLVIAANTGQPLLVGNLETRRDYTDVRDIVKTYTALALAPSLSASTYNICSGVSRSGNEVLATLIYHTGLQAATQQDPKLIRPNDPPELYGDNQLLTQATGWKPTIPFDQTIKDFVAWKQSTRS